MLMIGQPVGRVGATDSLNKKTDGQPARLERIELIIHEQPLRFPQARVAITPADLASLFEKILRLTLLKWDLNWEVLGRL